MVKGFENKTKHFFKIFMGLGHRGPFCLSIEIVLNKFLTQDNKIVHVCTKSSCAFQSHEFLLTLLFDFFLQGSPHYFCNSASLSTFTLITAVFWF